MPTTLEMDADLRESIYNMATRKKATPAPTRTIMDEVEEKSKKRPSHYAPNDRLMEEIAASKKLLDEKTAANPDETITPAECLTPDLVQMLMMIVYNYSQKNNWRNYTYIDDMRGDAILSLCQNALKFNPEKSRNPFGYYTQIVTHSFLTFLEKEKKMRRIRDDILEQNMLNPSHARQLENEERAREHWNQLHHVDQRGKTDGHSMD